MHHGDAALVDRGGEAGHVGDDAAADGDDHVVAGEAPLAPGAAQIFDQREHLAVLAGREHEHAVLDARIDVEAHAVLGDDGGAAAAGGPGGHGGLAPGPTTTS